MMINKGFVSMDDYASHESLGSCGSWSNVRWADVREGRLLKPVSTEEAQLLYDLGVAVYEGSGIASDVYMRCHYRPEAGFSSYGILKDG